MYKNYFLFPLNSSKNQSFFRENRSELFRLNSRTFAYDIMLPQFLLYFVLPSIFEKHKIAILCRSVVLQCVLF